MLTFCKFLQMSKNSHILLNDQLDCNYSSISNMFSAQRLQSIRLYIASNFIPVVSYLLKHLILKDSYYSHSN